MELGAGVARLRGAAPSPSEKTHSSHTLRVHSCSASVPAAPVAQCWTGTQYMPLVIQWICLQPSVKTQ